MYEKRKRIVFVLVLSSCMIADIYGSLVIMEVSQIASELNMGKFV